MVCMYCNAEQPGFKKEKGKQLGEKKNTGILKKIGVGAVVVFFLCIVLTFIGSLFSGDETVTSTQPGQQAAAVAATFTPTTSPPTNTPTPDVKAQAIQIDYKELARNTESYIGSVVYYRGQVSQVQEGFGDNYALRIAVTLGSFVWDDHLYVHYSGETRLLEEDIVDLWLRIDGRKTYEALLGNQITIPEATVLLFELVDAQIERAVSPQENQIGSRPNPIPAGSAHLTANGNEVHILSVNYNAWAVVQAENRFNDPPGESKRYVMVEVMITNVNGSASESVQVGSTDFDLVGDMGVLYEKHCGVLPDEMSANLFRGGSTSGNFCLEVDNEDENLLAVYDPSVLCGCDLKAPVYFKLSQSGQ